MGESHPTKLKAALQAMKHDVYGGSGWACDISLAFECTHLLEAMSFLLSWEIFFITNVDIGSK